MNFSRLELLSTLIFAQLLLTPFPTVAQDSPLSLPRTAPVPEAAGRHPEPSLPNIEGPAPVPKPRPDEARLKPSAPADAPLPAEKPTVGETKEEPKPAKPLADPRSANIAEDKMPDKEIACRKRLNVLGVAFEDRKAKRDPDAGCSLPYPLAVKSLGATIELAPEAMLDCQMVEALARFTKDIASPAAKAQLGSELKSVTQASAYVCRPRHNGQKMSEHAFGNALDISSFTLKNAMVVEIGAATPEKQAKFLDVVRKSACGPFKTVLGPGSDADHARHFHLDLEPRRNGGTFCQ
jgi:hypothetical protein